MRCAVVEPTNPPPTTVTFFLMRLLLSFLRSGRCRPPDQVGTSSGRRYIYSPRRASFDRIGLNSLRLAASLVACSL